MSENPEYQYVTYETLDDGTIARIMLDRADARNAQNRGMLVELNDAFLRAEADDTVRVVILGGNGPLTMRQAAQWADVWYPTGPAADPDLKRAVPAFKRMVAEAGRAPNDVRVGLAPAVADAARLERLAANGVDECNVAVMGTDEADLLRNLDALTVARKQVFGS